uniref:Archaic translocase of outer membrane 11 kDa subunit n=1 Tax=Neobodo designis TaxID=312471 RepID=A0A7S1R6M6_NEODS|mmetsp:Transcript_9551/g.29524  ORF Transcript_9551/g.29524 Transcript_9551/m.29524 type:complete len:113 (+) Transcript_9551:53-391(+)
MFGMGMPQQPKTEWADMYFYQKLQHLVDSGADFVHSKMSWWLPAVGISMAGSLFLFSGGDIFNQGAMLLSHVALPHPTAPAFGQRLPPEAMGGPGGDDEDDEAALDLDASDE